MTKLKTFVVIGGIGVLTGDLDAGGYSRAIQMDVAVPVRALGTRRRDKQRLQRRRLEFRCGQKQRVFVIGSLPSGNRPIAGDINQ
jgi:hypothetical protein